VTKLGTPSFVNYNYGPNTIRNIVYLTKIIGVERIKENTCISICGRIFALMQTLPLSLQSKQKMRPKELP
jgi:hypothetical protein